MTPDAHAFAREWVAAWNARDLDRILSHYAEDIVFLSPYAERITGSGRVDGLDALRRYWRTGLAANPDLHFTLDAALAGHNAVTVLYRNHRGQQVAETVEFGESGKVVRSFACYA
jgi:hypothetical protein